jgi:hypothetical protein
MAVEEKSKEEMLTALDYMSEREKVLWADYNRAAALRTRVEQVFVYAALSY